MTRIALIVFLSVTSGFLASAQTITVSVTDPEFKDIHGCNGSKDDTAALREWAASLSSTVIGYVPGICKTSAPITFPSRSDITINGNNAARSQIVYTGAKTTGDLFVFGNNAEFTTGLHISNISFETETQMISGATLHNIKNFNCLLNNVWVGQVHTSNNVPTSYIGYWNDTTGACIHTGFNYSGSLEDLRVTGQAGYPTADTWFSHGWVLNGTGIGLHVGGGVAGLNFESGSILNNGQSLLVDESVVPVSNAQIFFGSQVYMDISRDTTKPDVELSVSDSTIQSTINFANSWFASSATGQPCLQIDSTFKGYVNIWGGNVAACSTDGIRNNSASANVTIISPVFNAIGGWAINNAANDPNFVVSLPVWGSSVPNKSTGLVVPNNQIGLNNGGAPMAGTVGEQISTQNAGGVSVISSTFNNVVTATLSPGYWICSAAISTRPAATTVNTYLVGGLTANSRLIPGPGDTNTFFQATTTSAGFGETGTLGPAFFSPTTPTVIYLTGYTLFSDGPERLNGTIHCTRGG